MLIKRILTSVCIRSRWAEKRPRHITFVYTAYMDYFKLNKFPTPPQFNFKFPFWNLYNYPNHRITQIWEQSLRITIGFNNWYQINTKVHLQINFHLFHRTSQISSAKFNMYLTRIVKLRRYKNTRPWLDYANALGSKTLK